MFMITNQCLFSIKSIYPSKINHTKKFGMSFQKTIVQSQHYSKHYSQHYTVNITLSNITGNITQTLQSTLHIQKYTNIIQLAMHKCYSQHYTLQHDTLQHYTLQHDTLQHYTLQRNSQNHIILHSQQCTVNITVNIIRFNIIVNNTQPSLNKHYSQCYTLQHLSTLQSTIHKRYS